jgi:hypothetical protein
MGVLSAPGHMESTVHCTQHCIRPVIWPGAIWTPRGKGRLEGLLYIHHLKKLIRKLNIFIELLNEQLAKCVK